MIKYITQYCETDNIQCNLQVQQTVTSSGGVKRRMVTLQSPTKKKCILQLWRDQVILGDKIGML